MSKMKNYPHKIQTSIEHGTFECLKEMRLELHRQGYKITWDGLKRLAIDYFVDNYKLVGAREVMKQAMLMNPGDQVYMILSMDDLDEIVTKRIEGALKYVHRK